MCIPKIWFSSLRRRLLKDEKKADMNEDAQEQAQEITDIKNDLTQRVSELEEEVAKLRTSLFNQVSDNARLQRIAEREKSQQDAKTRKEIAKLLLPVADDLERAYSMLGDDANRSSVEFIMNSLRKALEGIGLVELNPEGSMFDPNTCELGGQEPSEHPTGTVCRTARKGYSIGDELIRPAIVICSVCQTKSTEETNEQDNRD
jgi:molecular chaperone GrpE (heat shock protein)